MYYPNIKKFPKEFGKVGGFPKLELFLAVEMKRLEKLPIVEKGALPSLKTLAITKCEALQRLPQCYCNLKSIEKIRVYGCPNVQHVMAEEKDFINTQRKVHTITLSITKTKAFEKCFNDMFSKLEYEHYGEYWSSEIFQFLHDINTFYLF
ncbi:hypothetical protein SUGI_0529330 [Cryptomeria japonica]|nr:hypothetical protein SUGI_0529330 [Cryptomeria japonica]